jgi:hypothetical protein
MFCPQCSAEYRQGFTRCSDCDADLVYAVPREGERTTDPNGRANRVGERDRRLIWKGNNQAACVFLCRRLMKADIPYKVDQIPESRNFLMRVKWRYDIGVPETDYERAKELLGIEGEFADTCYDMDDDNDDEREEGDLVESLIASNSPPDPEIRNDSYLESWYPEDATVEIWSQDGDDISFGVEMALRENLIHCRWDVHDGVRKAFVMPEDEARAREIVREIIEDAPPE